MAARGKAMVVPVVSRIPWSRPVTSAPNDLAICTANIPTPPEAPTIRTCCPGWIPPALRKAWRTVKAEVGTAAACSKVRFAGLGASMSARASAYSQRRRRRCRRRRRPPELRHLGTDRLDHARDIHAPNASLGRAESEADDAHQVGL